MILQLAASVQLYGIYLGSRVDLADHQARRRLAHLAHRRDHANQDRPIDLSGQEILKQQQTRFTPGQPG